MAKAKYYVIQSQVGCWGSFNRSRKRLVTRVDGAMSRSHALELFRARSSGRSEYEKEYKALTPSELNAEQRDWIENYAEDIIDASKQAESDESMRFLH